MRLLSATTPNERTIPLTRRARVKLNLRLQKLPFSTIPSSFFFSFYTKQLRRTSTFLFVVNYSSLLDRNRSSISSALTRLTVVHAVASVAYCCTKYQFNDSIILFSFFSEDLKEGKKEDRRITVLRDFRFPCTLVPSFFSLLLLCTKILRTAQPASIASTYFGTTKLLHCSLNSMLHIYSD